MASAEFSYAKWYARLTLIGIPFVALLGLLLLAGGMVSLIDMPTVADKLSASAVLLLGFWMLVTAWLRIRYIHVLSSRYVISADGIFVSTPRSTHELAWSQITGADYFPMLFFLRLAPDSGGPTIALFLDNKGPWDHSSESRNAAAKSLIQKSLGVRYRRKWLP